MGQYKDVEVGSTVYFWFAANTTAGTAGDGAIPLYDVRLAGAASNAAPTASGTPTLLTHANYTDGLHEIAIDTTGYALGEYAVFCTLTISTVNPAGFVGSFLVKQKLTGLVVDDVANSSSTFKSDRTEAVDDYWKDALLRFTSGNLAGQVKKITGYNGTTKFFTTGAFTAEPTADDNFALINK